MVLSRQLNSMRSYSSPASSSRTGGTSSSSSSSLPSSLSSFFPNWNHDVFLSFRGEDTRRNFVSHLRRALVQEGVSVFTDEHLTRGESISQALLDAIEGSRISIVVFSPNYASSTWCLDELVKILECRHSKRQLVRPVFLHVNPSEMRKGSGVLGEILRNHEEDFNFKDDGQKVRRWRLALHEAANLSGWHLQNNGVEAELIQKIVEEVSNTLLNHRYMTDAKYPVGLDKHLQAISSLLDKGFDKVRMIGICGPGGIGKTTVAKALYKQIADRFESSSFLDNVTETLRQHGLVKLQELLLQDMLRDQNIKVGDVDRGSNLIEGKLRHRRVLLVLDDIKDLCLVEKLTGEGDWFGFGSMIIMTSSRNQETLDALGAEIYLVDRLNSDDALELFCWNAFEKASPTRDHELMSICMANCANGIPLFIILLGSFLHGKSTQEWDHALNRLRAPAAGVVDEIMQMSYDGLELSDRAIFLDIACFFNGEDKDFVVKLLDRCNFSPESGLAILEKRSLIYIDKSNKIRMHDSLQEMGRQLVRSESPDDPGRRSRLWHHRDVLQVLQENSGTNAIEAIKLDMIEPEELIRSRKTLKKMNRLRLMFVRNMHISGCPEYISSQLNRLDVDENENASEDSSSAMGMSPAGDQKHSYDRPLQNQLMRFREFSLEELCQSTDNFSKGNMIEMGTYGSMYRGRLMDRGEVTVKRAETLAELDDDGLVTEARILSRVNHNNVIQLVGFLEEGDERALVFKHTPNNSLHHHLHSLQSSPLMSWITRLKVALDAAKGLEYLHVYAVPPIIHGDVQSSNVLLDINWTAKISNFGLSMLLPEDVAPSLPLSGTIDHINPEYYAIYQLKIKSDVYNFGLLLLELLSGHEPIYSGKNGLPCNVIDLVVPRLGKRCISEILDQKMPIPTLPEMEALEDAAYLAADCVQFEANDRPTMTDVVYILRRALDKCLYSR